MAAAPGFRRVGLSSDDNDGIPKPVVVSSPPTSRNPNYDYSEAPIVTPFSGGHAYENGRNGLPTRHRFLYWHCYGTVLELHERSLDLELIDNCVAFQFNAPVFQSIIVEEVEADNFAGALVCLNFVLADGTLVRLGFPHPEALPLSPNRIPGAQHPSVLQQQPKVWQMGTGDIPTAVAGAAGTVVVAATDGSVLAHLLPVINGLHRNEPYDCVPLNNKNMAQRIITGLTPQFLRPVSAADRVVSLCSIRNERWNTTFTLSASLELKAHRLLRGDERETSSLSVFSLRDFIDDPAISALNLQSEHHALRICDTSDTKRGTSFIAAHIASTVQSVVMIFRCKWVIGEEVPVVRHIGTKLGTPGTLVDLEITDDNLWFLLDVNGVPTVYHGSVAGDPTGTNKLSFVSPSMDVDDAVVVPDNRTIREAYSDFIFHRKLFSSSVIVEAISVYGSGRVELSGPIELKQIATRAVEEKIVQRGLGEDVENNCWYEFLQNCLHFWRLENAVQGVFCDQTTGFAYVVKRRGIEMLRQFVPIDDGSNTDPDVLRLLDCMRLASELFGPDVSKNMFINPHMYCTTRASEVLLNDSLAGDTGASFAAKMAGIVELPTAVSAVLDSLDGINDDPMIPGGNLNLLERLDLLSSQHGVSILADSISNFVGVRLERARDLLLALALASRLRQQAAIQPEDRATLAQEAIPRASRTFQELYILNWIATTPSSHVTDASIEASIRHLHIIGASYTPPPLLTNNAATILELFLLERDNLRELQDVPELEGLENYEWPEVIDFMAMALVPLVRAKKRDDRLSPNISFCRFLLQRCQLEQLHEYILMLGRDSASGSFMLAQIQLRNGELHKAKANFLRAVSAVEPEHDEAPIFRRLVGLRDEPSQSGMFSKAAYYVKVMEFFKESIPRSLNALDEVSKPDVFSRLHSPEIVVSFARAALRSIDAPDGSLTAKNLVSMLWTTIFQYSLDLGDNDSAYAAAIANPDPDTRGDCVQRLIGVLCERGDTRAVVCFSYIGAPDKALDVLKTKAKNLDMLAVFLDWNEDAQESTFPRQRSVNYYQILHSFYIHRADFHAAGMTMFECASRLELEYQFLSPEGSGLSRCKALLAHQRDAMLAAINALNLVDEDQQWFVRHREVSKKRRRDDFAQPNGKIEQAEVDVLALADLHLEYALILARLRLLEDETVDAVRVLSKSFDEVNAVTLLVGRGHFDLALTLVKLQAIEIPLAARSEIFVTLADRCARLTINPTIDYEWLNQNDIELGPAAPEPLGNSDPLDERNTSTHSADRGWELLRILLRMYDSTPSNNYRHHLDAADRIMSLRIGKDGESGDVHVPLPMWLIGSLEKRHRTGLLRLYIKHNDLKRATSIALSMIDNADIKKPDDRVALNRLLPYSDFDSLLAKLKARETGRQKGTSTQESHDLASMFEESLNAYMDKLSRQDKVGLSFR